MADDSFALIGQAKKRPPKDSPASGASQASPKAQAPEPTPAKPQSKPKPLRYNLLADLVGQEVELELLPDGVMRGRLHEVGIFELSVEREDGSLVVYFKHGLLSIRSVRSGPQPPP